MLGAVLFPAPVGRIANTSRPLSSALTTCNRQVCDKYDTYDTYDTYDECGKYDKNNRYDMRGV